MQRRHHSYLVALAGFLTCFVTTATAQSPASWKNRLVVKKTGELNLDVLATYLGWEGGGGVDGLGLHSIGTGLTGAGVVDAMLTVSTMEGVEAVELDGRARPPETCDLFDPYSVQQCTIGFLDGQPVTGSFTGQSWMEDLGILEVQAYATGEPRLVAVIDSGLDLGHPVFDGRLASEGWDYVLGQAGAWDIPNGVDEDLDGYVDEAHGHGTHVASLITLVDPNALILPYRVVDADGRGWAFDVAMAVIQATLDGADVINLSLSVEPHSSALNTAIDFALFYGVDVISSAGNTSTGDVLYPATLDVEDFGSYNSSKAPHGVVSVTALDGLSTLAGFSASGNEVDLAAPGVDMYGALPGGSWGWWSGTSMATAVVSGAASLLRSTSHNSSLVSGGQLLVGTTSSVSTASGTCGRINVLEAYFANQMP